MNENTFAQDGFLLEANHNSQIYESDPTAWSINKVLQWLDSINLSRYCHVFSKFMSFTHLHFNTST